LTDTSITTILAPEMTYTPKKSQSPLGLAFSVSALETSRMEAQERLGNAAAHAPETRFTNGP
uniref:hypothetical protein n=1 Tax=Alistipes shahii TaxID=328814 RepID=UPI0040389C44